MVARTPNPYTTQDSFYTRYELGEVTITVNDTVTFTSFVDDSTIWQVLFVRKSNGAAVTCTLALNVATVTQAGLLDEPCFYFAYGIKTE
jgi:hypothetical protein